MLQSIFVLCPRGHYYKVGRVSPGLIIRVKARCSRCGEYHISFGAVTPFGSEIVPTHDGRLLTGITAGNVRRELEKLSDRPDANDILARLPGNDVQLNAASVLVALSSWIRHMSRKGAAVSEKGQMIEVIATPSDPSAGGAGFRGITRAA